MCSVSLYIHRVALQSRSEQHVVTHSLLVWSVSLYIHRVALQSRSEQHVVTHSLLVWSVSLYIHRVALQSRSEQHVVTHSLLVWSVSLYIHRVALQSRSEQHVVTHSLLVWSATQSMGSDSHHNQSVTPATFGVIKPCIHNWHKHTFGGLHLIYGVFHSQFNMYPFQIQIGLQSFNGQLSHYKVPG
ncbi:uncharacterized protein MELLADRAFT_105989 [Melampsora larici-populina 98AG31]|uniref:Uncharacterized protein n=1 Tax=Melampsora larici-populina (strain 98AG31 / pathotype 3-4-7) TaxID=747676 RepID=F4RK01_MELLP|nr:uncharacterized protein MELLADRAFT_105989 [Melampsora larici-populina 98AG31]EGG07409.1 hypothetical protein MELLADRAFT_105989 [Melampsora larici-populina 98AG31]